MASRININVIMNTSTINTHVVKPVKKLTVMPTATS